MDQQHHDTKMECYKLIAEMMAQEEEARRQNPWLNLIAPSQPEGRFSVTMKVMLANPHLLAPDADIQTYRAFVQTNGLSVRCHEKLKCSSRAADLRRDGNQLYVTQQYEAALKAYNESICAAPNDSTDLAIGYANRSAVYYAQELYDVALVNIVLAKKHNYPENLMPKLLTREANCRLKLKDKAVPLVGTTVELNPKIPFLANGIQARQHPIRGPIMVATKDFKAGAVILREKPMMACVSDDNLFTRCNYCISTNLSHFIPCPGCASAMFCDEECMRKAQKVHRFECGICAEVSSMCDFWLGPRMFFHGLSLCNDDVSQLIQVCKKPRGSDSFFSLDYSKLDPLEEFRTFLTAKPRRTEPPLYDNIIQLNAAEFYQMYMKIPLVRSLIVTEEQKDFMQQCFVDFQIKKRNLAFRQTSNGHLYPIASCFGHSCDPNTVLLEDSGNELRMIVQRPIRRGDQIHFTFGPSYDQTPKQHEYNLNSLGFDCLCDFCDPVKRKEWMAKNKKPSAIDPVDWDTVRNVGEDAELTDADKMNAIQPFIERYGSSHPQSDYTKMVRIYSKWLTAAHNFEMYYATQRKICGST